jgi:hypothetical protein
VRRQPRLPPSLARGQAEAGARPSRARDFGAGRGGGGRSEAWRCSWRWRRTSAWRCSCAEAASPPSLPRARLGGLRRGGARARGGGTSAWARLTDAVHGPRAGPTQPVGAAPSVEIWRTRPTRIISEYSFGVQPILSSTPIQTLQKRVEPIRVGPDLPTKHTESKLDSNN